MPEAIASPDFSRLRPYEARRFVPETADLEQKEQVIGLYRKLLDREIDSREELEQWVLDRSELEAALDQTGTVLYIRMTCQTDDEARAEAYQQFIEIIVPEVKPLDDQLNRKYLEARKSYPLDECLYEVYDREIVSDVELFVAENVPLQTEVSLSAQEYQKICGKMMVEFQGQERTLPEMAKFLQEPDRELREEAWRASSDRRLKDKEKLDELFDKMLSLRHRVARNAGCSNFCDYQFKAYQRFDYTPADCRTYHQSVAKLVVPVWRKILQRRKETLGYGTLRPWDLSVDPKGRPPLRPFQKVEDLIGGVRKIFERIHPDLGRQFQEMVDLGVLDLSSRKGKAPGGYQSSLDEARKPFIFMNAVGVHQDVSTLLHEGGHAFHALACAHHPLLDYRHGPMEFNEVASMGMELLAGEHWDVFYNEEDRQRAREQHFEDVVHVLAWVATVDAFQQWIYDHPEQTAEERRRAWVESYQRFGGGVVAWDGWEEALSFLWHRQLHVFEVPFYYIEYGIAQLGALQLWTNARRDRAKALEDYRRGLSLGGSRPLPEIYRTAGLRFDFSPDTIGPLMEEVQKELNL